MREQEIILIPKIETSSRVPFMQSLAVLAGRLILYDKFRHPPILSRYPILNEFIVQPVTEAIKGKVSIKLADLLQVIKAFQLAKEIDDLVSSYVNYHKIYDEKNHITWQCAVLEIKESQNIFRIEIQKHTDRGGQDGSIRHFRFVYEYKLKSDKIRYEAAFIPLTENNMHRFFSLYRFLNFRVIAVPHILNNNTRLKAFPKIYDLKYLRGITRSKYIFSEKRTDVYSLSKLQTHIQLVKNILNNPENWQYVGPDLVINILGKDQTAVRLKLIDPAKVKSKVKIHRGDKGKIIG